MQASLAGPQLWVVRRIPGTPGNWCHCIVFACFLLTALMFNFNLTLKGVFLVNLFLHSLSHVGGRTDCVSLLFFPVVSSFSLPSEKLSYDWLRAWTLSTVCYPVSLHGAAKSSCLICTRVSWFEHWSRLKGSRSTWTKVFHSGKRIIPLPNPGLLLWLSQATDPSLGDYHVLQWLSTGRGRLSKS